MHGRTLIGISEDQALGEHAFYNYSEGHQSH